MGAIERANQSPSLGDGELDVSHSAWNNNWADWDNTGSHNEWDNWAPTPPGGK